MGGGLSRRRGGTATLLLERAQRGRRREHVTDMAWQPSVEQRAAISIISIRLDLVSA